MTYSRASVGSFIGQPTTATSVILTPFCIAEYLYITSNYQIILCVHDTRVKSQIYSC